MAKVSIIIPVYNVAECIEESLRSALQQSFTDIEYLIVDDKGSDDSMKIVRDIIKDSSQDIKIIEHDKNKGLSVARNTGITYATGDYVFFMDSDDIISEDCIDKLHAEAVKNHADWVDANVMVKGGSNNYFIPYVTNTHVSEKDAILKSLYEGYIHISAWNKLIKRNWLVDKGIIFKEGLIYEDILFVLEMCEKAEGVSFIPDFTYTYIIRDNSITTTLSLDKIERQYRSQIYIINELCLHLKEYLNLAVKNSAERWLDRYKFKSASRLITLPIDDKSKRRIYKKLKNKNQCNKSFYSMALSLPYMLFKSIFYVPYKTYKLINSHKNK